MNRIRELQKYISKKMHGIEIAPWHSGIVPKMDGWNVKIMDILSQNELLDRAKNNKNISKKLENIEFVDYVGSACEIDRVVLTKEPNSSFDYIISSHNFEHLPDPISFLSGCEKILKPDGLLIMAIPDSRFCFDRFKPHSTTADWIAAFLEKRSKPSKAQLFVQETMSAFVRVDEVQTRPFRATDEPKDAVPNNNLASAYHSWLSLDLQAPYRDCHCSFLNPNIFGIIITELMIMGLTKFSLIDLSETNGHEFYVYLKLETGILEKNTLLSRRAGFYRKAFAECT